MGRKRNSRDDSGENGHADQETPVEEVERQYCEFSKYSTSLPDLQAGKSRRSKSSRKSLTWKEEAKKRSTECLNYNPSTPEAKMKKPLVLDFNHSEERGPDTRNTPIGEVNKKSSFSSKFPVRTSTLEMGTRKSRNYSGVPGPEYASSLPREINRGIRDSEVSMCTPEERSLSTPSTGLDHEATLIHKTKRRMTEESEPPLFTPLSQIRGRDAHCIPLTVKLAKSQKKLFCGPDDKAKRCKDDDEEERGWASDRRRKDLDHGKFTEDEIISLNCGLNQLMEARNWTREEAAKILTHQSGRGNPHAEARGAWKEIAKFLPSSSIVRVNMKVRELLFKGKTGRWDAEETERLKRLVQKHGNNWTTIACHLGRSNGACARKWRSIRTDECTFRKRGKWTQDEYDELCRHVRDAKATKIFKSTKRIGKRKVRDDLCWEPIALRMCRPANQCSAVWYERLAPSMHKELCLDEKDRQWSDEDDRRLLTRMLRLMSPHGSICWRKVYLKNRKTATCKARFNQMTHPKCLGEKHEATLHEKLEILVRRYAPDLTVQNPIGGLDESRIHLVEEMIKRHDSESDFDITESRREEYEWTMNTFGSDDRRSTYKSRAAHSQGCGDQQEDNILPLRMEKEVDCRVRGTPGFETKRSKDQRKIERESTPSGYKFEENDNLSANDSMGRESEWGWSSPRRKEEDEYSVHCAECDLDPVSQHRPRVQERKTVSRYIVYNSNQRNLDLVRETREDSSVKDVRVSRKCCTRPSSETSYSLECQNCDRKNGGNFFYNLTKHDRSKNKTTFYRVEQGNQCTSVGLKDGKTVRESSYTDDESTSLDF
ncbi:protein Mp1R-MYB18 [Marchantia polymorpha subsp. ruderalis]|nr:hypothetical protein MARPO_0091s0012 [Marchantia polymorpha]BBN15672.1 hypothetical protein Mp_6g21430 [Marchantia polymorpha subsp. ruderalis]|eukprot:PTQ33142.1 hypothetical protein MARPO_0091s0012 [Marchantia polymorpha]